MPGGYGVEYGRGYGGVIEIDTRKPKDDGYPRLRAARPHRRLAHARGQAHQERSRSPSPRAARPSTPGCPTSRPTASSSRRSTTTTRSSCTGSRRRATISSVFVFGSDDAINVHLQSSRSGDVGDARLAHLLSPPAGALSAPLRHARTLTVTPSVGYDQPIAVNGSFGNTAIDVQRRNARLRPARRWRACRSTRWLRARRRRRLRRRPLELRRLGAVRRRHARRRHGRRRRLRRRSMGLLRTTLTLYDQQHGAVRRAQLRAARQAAHHHAAAAPRRLRLQRLSTSPDSFSTRLRQRRAAPGGALPDQSLGRGQGGDRRSTTSRRRSFDLIARRRQSASCCPSTAGTTSLGADFDPYRDAAHRGRGLLQGSAPPRRPRRARGRSDRRTNDGIGRVYGGELLVRQELFHNFFGWVAYTLSRSERKDHPDEPWRLFRRPDAHPDHHRQLQAAARLSGRHALPLRHRQSVHADQQAYFNVVDGDVRRRCRAIRSRSGSPTSTSSTCASTRRGPSIAGGSASTSTSRTSTTIAPRSRASTTSTSRSRSRSPGLPFVPDLGIRGDF